MSTRMTPTALLTPINSILLSIFCIPCGSMGGPLLPMLEVGAGGKII